jgi:N-acetylglucosamine kinase-like BadF-type ATPase
VTGDWGGGHHIAQLMLWHAARGEDGRGPGTALIDVIARHFGLTTVEDVGIAIHLGNLTAERINELTPMLFEIAAAGDGVATSIVMRQVKEVVLLASVAAGRLGLRNRPVDIVLGGGVLTARHPMLHDAVLAGLAEEIPHATVRVVDEPPVAGAVLLGLDALGAEASSKAAVRHSIVNSRSR